MNNFLVVVLGPTGIGKTGLGIEIASKLQTEIISSDSRQLYKELSIGTAVPSKEQLGKVKHHFIQNQSVYDYYNASMFETEVNELLALLFLSRKSVVMVGGSGFYIDAVCNGIDDIPSVNPELREKLLELYKTEGIESLRGQLKLLDPDYYAVADLRNYKRILKALEVSLMAGKPYSSLLTRQKKPRDFKIIKIGLNRDRDELHQIINQRVDKMIAEGLIEEARLFLKDKHLNSLNTVGYKELFDYFDDKTTLEVAIELIKRNTRRYARRQLTYFNRDKEIKWFHPDEKKMIEEYIESQLE
jgi:tRNA dimethylallyltransferase